MFERIVVRRSQAGLAPGPINIGELAESILFYGQVDLQFNRPNLAHLLRSCGPDVLLRLVEGGYVRGHFVDEFLGVYTENAGTSEARHGFSLARIEVDPMADVRRILQEAGGKSGASRRFANRFLNATSAYEHPGGITEGTRRVIDDAELLGRILQTIVQHLAPTYRLREDLKVRLVPAGDYFQIQTNLDMRTFNKALRLTAADTDERTIAHVLVELLETYAEMVIARDLACDVSTTALSSDLMPLLGARSGTAPSGLKRFNDFILEGRSVAEAINSGERTFNEFFPVLDRSINFRDWVKNRPPDADLAREYAAQLSQGT